MPPNPVGAAIRRGEGRQRGQTKYRRKRNRGLTSRRFPHYARRKAPIFRPPGLLHWPTVLPLPISGPTDAGARRPWPGSPGRQPQGRAGAAEERAAAGAGGGLGPFGESQALFSIVNKEREISPSADASADTQVLLGGGGKGERKCHFFPGENTSEAFLSAEKGNFRGAGEEGKGIGGRGRKIHHQLGPKGLDLNAVELYFQEFDKNRFSPPNSPQATGQGLNRKSRSVPLPHSG